MHRLMPLVLGYFPTSPSATFASASWRLPVNYWWSRGSCVCITPGRITQRAQVFGRTLWHVANAAHQMKVASAVRQRASWVMQGATFTGFFCWGAHGQTAATNNLVCMLSALLCLFNVRHSNTGLSVWLRVGRLMQKFKHFVLFWEPWHIVCLETRRIWGKIFALQSQMRTRWALK